MEIDEQSETESNDSLQESPDKGGRPRAKLEDLSDRQQNRRLKDLVKVLDKTCKNESIQLDKLLGLVGRRMCSTAGDHFNFEKSQVFGQIYDGINPYRNNELSVEQACFVKESLEIGRRKFTNFRTFMQPFVKMPSAEKIRNFQHDISTLHLEKVVNQIYNKAETKFRQRIF